MTSKAKTVTEYLASLPQDRRAAISAVREVILKQLPKGYEEGMQYGMIGYYVPHSIFPAGYHCNPKQPLPFASLASQKNYMAVYLMCVYGDGEIRKSFEAAIKASGKKLDDLPLDVLGKAIAKVPVANYVASYEAARKQLKNCKKK